MIDNMDWIGDPFIKTEKSTFQVIKPVILNDKLSELWSTYHFASRLKLEAAVYFCRQIFGAVSLPDDIGLPLQAHRQQKWYLDAFFFELMGACDTLLQELNIIYLRENALEMEDVRWQSIKNGLSDKIVKYAENIYKEEWFTKIRRYRNIATHYAYVPTSSWKSGSGDLSYEYDDYKLSLFYIAEDKKKFVEEDINMCKNYLTNIIDFVRQIWGIMSDDFSSK